MLPCFPAYRVFVFVSTTQPPTFHKVRPGCRYQAPATTTPHTHSSYPPTQKINFSSPFIFLFYYFIKLSNHSSLETLLLLSLLNSSAWDRLAHFHGRTSTSHFRRTARPKPSACEINSFPPRIPFGNLENPELNHLSLVSDLPSTPLFQPFPELKPTPPLAQASLKLREGPDFAFFSSLKATPLLE